MSYIAQLSAFILQYFKVSCITISISFSFEPYDYNVENIYTYYIVPTIINALSMYVISLLCNIRLGVGTLIMATSSAINKKITLQSTSATNVASVAFAI